MASYKQLTAQLEKLHKEVAAAREKEIAQAIADIKQKVAEYDLTAEELGFTTSASRRAKRPRRRSPDIAIRRPARPGAVAAARPRGLPARIASAF